MSIEKLIQENTEALQILTSAINSLAGNLSGKTDVAPKETAPVAKKKAAVAVKAVETVETPVEPKATEAVAEAIPYDKIKEATLNLIKVPGQGREGVNKLLVKFGASYTSAKDLKPEQYAEYLAAVNALLGKTEDEDIA